MKKIKEIGISVLKVALGLTLLTALAIGMKYLVIFVMWA